ncbi:helix-turn-helix domain-containing protein [Candidatus Woesearchaeota archaeon]|nr:helix-turn-helix domain-containing protein [Candidatus Woesearchaeota archaeon]
MELIQEIEVWYIIPAIRKEIALSMINNGLRQSEIAKKLGVTRSAINQYFKNKRGKDVDLGPKIRDNINRFAENIENPKESVRVIQELLNISREERIACQLHKNMDKEFEGCNVCYEKPQLIRIGGQK